MALTSALYTGLSGLNVAQTELTVVGNNIANANTVAFKSSQVIFSPEFYITQQAGTAPTSNFGGTNPSQYGLGAQVGAINTNFTPGSITSTGVDTDMAIDGNGFFVLNSSAGQQYTRDGSFTLNSSNQLVTANGAFVQGYGVSANGALNTTQLTNITIPIGQQTIAKATANVSFEGNLDASGAVASGSTILTSQAFSTVAGTAPTAGTLLTDLVSTAIPPAPLVSVGDALSLSGTVGSSTVAANSLTITATTTVGDLENFVNQALGIDTTVAEPGNPPPGATLQTTGTTGQLTIIGNSGTVNAITLNNNGISDSSGSTPFLMSAGTDGTFTSGAIGESISTPVTAYDSLGTPITVNVSAVLESVANTGTTWRFYVSSPNNLGGAGPVIGNGTLSFDTSGNLVGSTGTNVSINRSGTGALTPMVVNLNFGSVTSLSAQSSSLIMNNQDGEPIGSLTSFSVGTDGTVTGIYSNGVNSTLAQLALANFTNPNGLVNEGGNVYQSSGDSGAAAIAAPGSTGVGLVRDGSLEQSNVDISQEFINLITASSGFSAASHVISTSDQLLQALLNSQQG